MVKKTKLFPEIVKLIESECANYDGGDCLHLDCPCVQKISKCSFEDKGILLCNYFKNNVLPLKPELNAIINKGISTKECKTCHKPIADTANSIKYCKECADEMYKKQQAKYARKKRAEKSKN